jgi:hypothetical protein
MVHLWTVTDTAHRAASLYDEHLAGAHDFPALRGKEIRRRGSANPAERAHRSTTRKQKRGVADVGPVRLLAAG